MTNTDVFLWAATLLVGLGLSLVSYRALSVAADLVGGAASFVYRRFRPSAAQWLKEFSAAGQPAKERQLTPRLTLGNLLALRGFWLGGALLAASAAHDVLLSPTLFVIVAIAGELVRAGQRQKRLARLNEDAERLVVQFESRYPLLNSVTATLTHALESLPNRELRFAVQETVQRLSVSQSLANAIVPLSNLPNPSLHQMTVVLLHAQETDPAVFLDTLKMLRQDVESRTSLYHQVRQSLTLLRGTVRVLQAALSAALLAACILPMWRYYFLHGKATLLYLMLVVGTLGSFYVEAEIRQLEV